MIIVNECLPIKHLIINISFIFSKVLRHVHALVACPPRQHVQLDQSGDHVLLQHQHFRPHSQSLLQGRGRGGRAAARRADQLSADRTHSKRRFFKSFTSDCPVTSAVHFIYFSPFKLP